MQLHDPVFVAQQVALYYNTRQGLFSNNRGIALTMLPLRNMTDRYKELVEQARKEDPIIYLPPGVDPRVLEGFKSVCILVQIHLPRKTNPPHSNETSF